MNRPAPDFDKEPWKHPAVWESHLVRNTRDYSDGVAFAVRARDAAVHTHWHDVIKASAVPA